MNADASDHAQPTTRKVRIALVFGGRSSEHEVSCSTAASVLSALDRDRYDVIPVGIARDGHWFVNTSGNPGMASAGMGDVLAGILGALLAQKFSGESALVLGTHLHGCAADECVRAGAGPVGLTAGELIDPARSLWNRWLG